MTSAPAPPPSSQPLEVAGGKVTGSIHRRHRAAEFKKFLAKLDKKVSTDLDTHLILDNYATHKTPVIKKRLLAHPRFHLHTQKRLRRGVHRSGQALERDIRAWGADWNDSPRPFV